MSKWLTMHQTTAKADKGLYGSWLAAHTAARHVFLAAGVARPQRDSAINFQSRLTRAGQLRRIAELRQASVACRLFSCGNEKSWRQLISWCANQGALVNSNLMCPRLRGLPRSGGCAPVFKIGR